MKIKVRVYHTKKLEATFKALSKKAQNDASQRIVVGYSAPYAMYVHEAVGMVLQGLPRASGHGHYWDPQGQAQAKFLEQPSRQYAKSIGEYITAQVRKKIPLVDALLSAGKILLKESQRLVPVDTGRLKASGFVKIKS